MQQRRLRQRTSMYALPAKQAPYNPEENGVAELINRTFLNGTREVLTSANMGCSYCPILASNVPFKQKLLVHGSTTNLIPNHDWSET